MLVMPGCEKNDSPVNEEAHRAGKMTLSFSETPGQISKIVILLSREGFTTIVREILIGDSSNTSNTLIENIPIGRWHLKVQALDASNVVQFVGEAGVEVFSGESSLVTLQLIPANGNVEIRVTWGGRCVPPPVGIVAWWRAEGNGLDVVNGNSGSLGGGLMFERGRVGSAFSFDGVDDYVKVHADTSLSVVSFTIEAWIFPRAPFPNDGVTAIPIFEYNDELNTLTSLGVHFLHSEPVRLWGGGPGCLYANLMDLTSGDHRISSPANVLRPNAWNHVALTFNQTSGTARLFSNGHLVAEKFLGLFIPRTNTPLFIGTRPLSGPNAVGHFDGSIDELSLYRRVLAPDEIFSIYAAGNAGKCR